MMDVAKRCDLLIGKHGHDIRLPHVLDAVYDAARSKLCMGVGTLAQLIMQSQHYMYPC